MDLGHGLAERSSDCAFAAIVQLCRDASDSSFAPRSIHMIRDKPPPSCELSVAEYFRCPIHYNALENRIVFPAAALDAPLGRPNPTLAQAADHIAQAYVDSLDKTDLVDRARAVITEELPGGEPNSKAVASALAVSDRALAQRLNAQGSSVEKLVEECRRLLARKYLRQTGFSIVDVTFLLGFKDQSDFSRAFKRWSDQTPAEFRAKARAASTE